MVEKNEKNKGKFFLKNTIPIPPHCPLAFKPQNPLILSHCNLTDYQTT